MSAAPAHTLAELDQVVVRVRCTHDVLELAELARREPAERVRGAASIDPNIIERAALYLQVTDLIGRPLRCAPPRIAIDRAAGDLP